jgi:hypothetical protein
MAYSKAKLKNHAFLTTKDGIFREVRAEDLSSRQSTLREIELSWLRVQLWSVSQRITEAEEPPLLRLFTRKSVGKASQRNSHCGGMLPRKD